MQRSVRFSKLWVVMLVLALVLSSGFFIHSAVAAYCGYPCFTITSVDPGNTVSIQPYNFPPNDTFNVYMGPYGTYGIGGCYVTTVTTDAQGHLSSTTFNIPPIWAHLSRVAIRLESPTSGYYAYNWFYNVAAGGSGGSGYVGYPTFSIASVKQDQEVTIAPHNFPPNDTYVVRMNYYGTYGIGGWEVATVTTDANGALSQTTFSIPSALAGQYRIAIRLESPTTHYYAYNWFYNNTTGSGGSGGATPVVGPPGYPYFFIAQVERNDFVVIKGHNFPPNDKYAVLMNYYGTYGVGGWQVATVETDDQGHLKETKFSIPPALANQQRIAIRLQSLVTPYYAYNWFYNYDAVVPVP